MRIVIFGGSSQSTPVLFQCLTGISHSELTVTLIGRSRANLAAVERAAKLLLGHSRLSITCAGIQEPAVQMSLVDAHIVIIQVRVGGYRGRAYDETFPLKFGVCGDEGLGPGGLSAAWRAWPTVRKILSQVQEIAPEALVLMLTSPVGILVRAARRLYPESRVYGICELPWVTLLEICQQLGADPSKVCFDYFGANHLGWFHHLSYGRRNLIDEYQQFLSTKDLFPSARLVADFSAVPLKYFRLHYCATQVLGEQISAPAPRGVFLERLRSLAFRTFHNGTREEIALFLQRRPAPWYPHALGPLLRALMGLPVRIPFFLSVPNDGFEPMMPYDDVVEVPYMVQNGCLKPVPRSRTCPERILGLTREFTDFERIASSAIVSRDSTSLEDALRSHPWTRRVGRLEHLLEHVTSGSVDGAVSAWIRTESWRRPGASPREAASH